MNDEVKKGSAEERKSGKLAAENLYLIRPGGISMQHGEMCMKLAGIFMQLLKMCMQLWRIFMQRVEMCM